jgi:hypothetical protein
LSYRPIGTGNSPSCQSPPRPKGLGWLSAVGPGVIALGVSIGSGEFLLGPPRFVQHGFSLLWVVLIAIVFQTIFNTEVMRYTLATGEPVFSGFMRTRPSSTLWAWVYVALYFLQVGWPAWAGDCGGRDVLSRGPTAARAAADATTTYFIGVARFLAVRRDSQRRQAHRAHTGDLNWILVTTTIGGFLILAVLFVPSPVWLAAGIGFTGFDLTQQRFDFFPAGADLVLLGALVAYSGSGGVTNLVLGNWARDRGYGMGERAGYIPAAGGPRSTSRTWASRSHRARTHGPLARLVAGRIGGSWGVFFAGAILGMVLPALLYVTFPAARTDIQGSASARRWRPPSARRPDRAVAIVIAFLGAWILFKTQLDNFEGMVRAVTDILWTGSSRVRAWRGGGRARRVLHGARRAGGVGHLRAAPRATHRPAEDRRERRRRGVRHCCAALCLYVNTRILPPHVRPPMWRRVALAAMAVFYAFFVTLSIASVW